MLQLRQARQTLAARTIAAEHLPDMLYEPTGDGLPRVLPDSKESSPSPWAEIRTGVFARFTVLEGHLGRNLLEFRVTSKANTAINNLNTVARKNFDKNLQVSDTTEQAITIVPPNPLVVLALVGYKIGHAIGRYGAQALISAIPSSTAHPCGDPQLTSTYDKKNPNYHYYDTISDPEICRIGKSNCTIDNVFKIMLATPSAIAPVSNNDRKVEQCGVIERYLRFF